MLIFDFDMGLHSQQGQTAVKNKHASKIMKLHTFPTTRTALAGLFSLAFSCFLFSACVSSKKFNESEAARAKTEKQLRDCTGQVAGLGTDTGNLGVQYRKLVAANKNLSAMSEADKQYLSGQLQGKDKMLAEQQRRVRDLQATLTRQSDAVSRLRSAVANALTGYKGDELTIENKNGKVYVSLQDKLLFPSGSTTPQPQGVAAIQKLTEVLAKNADIDIVVEGHTDNVPVKNGASYKDNWDLSVLRATTISRLMINNGIDAKRIEAAGRGEYFPVASNGDVGGRARNRHTEIVLSPRLDELYRILEPTQASQTGTNDLSGE